MGSSTSALNTSNLGDEESGWIFKVLECCDSTTRSSALFVCKRYTQMLTTEASFRWRLERLHIEDGVYFPLASSEESLDNHMRNDSCTFYKKSFLEFRQKWMLWRTDDYGDHCDYNSDLDKENKDPRNKESYNIQVSVRFKPKSSDLAQRSIAEKNATLPLHQRLALIRIQHNLTNNRDALTILKENGDWFKDKWSAIEAERLDEENEATSTDKENSSNVCNDTDLKQSLSCGVNSVDVENANVVIVDATKGLRNFQFEHVFPDKCTQTSVYENAARPLIRDFINGTNVSCLVYGVTGSGKTFTMFGEDDTFSNNGILSGLSGIVPRACREIFYTLSFRKANLNMKFDISLGVSYVEIYGSSVCDLLQGGSPCFQNKASSQRYVLGGAAEVAVETVEDVMETLNVGEKQKRRAATALNQQSSRAHSIFIVTLKQACKSTGVSRTSKLFLVDLGGSEQTKKSNVVSGTSKHFERLKNETIAEVRESSGDVHSRPKLTSEDEYKGGTPSKKDYSTGFVQSDRMREAVYINLGLMALKSCVNAIVSRNKYIPFADSKLTMMLSTALGGNSKTSIIVCASQDGDLVSETIAALKFGQSCRHIKNNVQSETNFLKQIIDNIDNQIKKCEEEIRKKECWEVREEKRQDALAENGTLESTGFGGVEIRKTTVLVGAEEERKLLGELLRKKIELTGGSIDDNLNGKTYGGSVGFGIAYKYGLGERRNENVDNSVSYRFGDVHDSNIPDAVKKGGGQGGWKTGDLITTDEDKVSTKITVMKKKSTLVYSGLSA